MKYKNIPIGKFRSKLEQVCNDLLLEAELPFEYEPFPIMLLDKFEYPHTSYMRIGKKFKNAQKVRGVKYVPDFLVKGKYLIETKGMLTPVARLKWKLLQQKIIADNLDYILFMPTNKTEIKETIKIIQELEGE